MDYLWTVIGILFDRQLENYGTSVGVGESSRVLPRSGDVSILPGFGLALPG